MKILWAALLTAFFSHASFDYKVEYEQRRLFFSLDALMGLRSDGLPLAYSCHTVNNAVRSIIASLGGKNISVSCSKTQLRYRTLHPITQSIVAWADQANPDGFTDIDPLPLSDDGFSLRYSPFMDIRVSFEAPFLSSDGHDALLRAVFISGERDCHLAARLLWQLQKQFLWRQILWSSCPDNHSPYAFEVEAIF